jgi:hypothetical protein
VAAAQAGGSLDEALAWLMANVDNNAVFERSSEAAPRVMEREPASTPEAALPMLWRPRGWTRAEAAPPQRPQRRPAVPQLRG